MSLTSLSSSPPAPSSYSSVCHHFPLLSINWFGLQVGRSDMRSLTRLITEGPMKSGFCFFLFVYRWPHALWLFPAQMVSSDKHYSCCQKQSFGQITVISIIFLVHRQISFFSIFQIHCPIHDFLIVAIIGPHVCVVICSKVYVEELSSQVSSSPTPTMFGIRTYDRGGTSQNATQ